MTAAILALVLMLAPVAHVLADAPLRPPALHLAPSPNGQFAALSDPAAGTRVIKVSTGETLWSIPGWFRSIFVSNDGEHVAIGYDGLNLIPLNAPNSLEMISFWHNGRKIRSVTLGEIVPSRSILKRTASHYYWGIISQINEHNELLVTRADGRQFKFNMATGASQ